MGPPLPAPRRIPLFAVAMKEDAQGGGVEL
jgi:hypothetical protein